MSGVSEKIFFIAALILAGLYHLVGAGFLGWPTYDQDSSEQSRTWPKVLGATSIIFGLILAYKWFMDGPL